MEKLKESFGKNDIEYKLLDRTALAALFEQKLPEGELAGYEVCKIHFNKEGERFGMYFPESESVPSNEQFGYEGSKAFFPQDLERAKDYMIELTSKLRKITNPSKI